jgi:hypothetical protein
MERTIHRAWYWTFLKAYVICYLFGVGAVMAGIHTLVWTWRHKQS